jgi:osmoprotectant transport system substrate-binding protein
MRKLGLIVIAQLLAFVLCFAGNGLAGEKSITVGNKIFTEQYIMGQMLKQLLEYNGFDVTLRSDLSSMALRAGMESGDIDLCAEYTGTAWMIYLKQEYTPGTTNREMFEKVKKADAKNGFHWFHPIWNDNTYGFASWSSFAKKHHLKTMSDLAAFYVKEDGDIPTFIDFEFATRPDGLSALQQFYDFEVSRSALKTSAPGVSLMALKTHKADVAMVFATDASLAEYDWYMYRDDKSFFPPYDLAPYIREETLEKYPEITEIIKKLTDTFPGGSGPVDAAVLAKCRKVWQKLNAQVDIERKEPSDVAHDYLVSKGLVR